MGQVDVDETAKDITIHAQAGASVVVNIHKKLPDPALLRALILEVLGEARGRPVGGKGEWV